MNEVAAALILADKTDVRRSRVRNGDFSTFDIHDRVNYAVVESSAKLTDDKKAILLCVTIDTEISRLWITLKFFRPYAALPEGGGKAGTQVSA